jgi:FAD/FMN-containing dehydrogenase
LSVNRVDTLKVRDAKDVEQAVRAAIAGEQPLEIIGHGTKRMVGQPMATNALLDLSALNAVKSYEPNELIITVEAGAPLSDVKSLIDSKNQRFAFEPMDTARLLGTPEEGTIGGMIGAGLAGPRRIQAGAARDHLLGANAVSGFGDSFKVRRLGCGACAEIGFARRGRRAWQPGVAPKCSDARAAGRNHRIGRASCGLARQAAIVVRNHRGDRR